MDVTALIAEAEGAIHQAAREHKRLERVHRTEARRLMGQLADFRAKCQALGLVVEIIPGRAKEAEPDVRDA